MTRHPFRPGSFVLGLLVVVATIGWFVSESDVASSRELAVAGAVTLIAGGVLGIALTLRRTS